jgi:hypothetical protein
VLPRGTGTNRREWGWALPILACGRSVYAPDIPSFVGAGRQTAPRRTTLRRSSPRSRTLWGSGGRSTPRLWRPPRPGWGANRSVGQVSIGEAHRAISRGPPLFANPLCAPGAWYEEQYRAARSPGLTETTLATLHTNLGPSGQRRVPLGELPRLQMPNLVLWGARDGVFPAARASDAVGRLLQDSSPSSPTADTSPTSSGPGSSRRSSAGFSTSTRRTPDRTLFLDKRKERG